MAEQHHQNHPKAQFQQKDEYSASKSLAVLTLFPIGGVCFLLSGFILTGTLIGVSIATPLFFIFSPVLVPVMLTVVFTVAGFITSGAFGITAFSSMAYIVNYFRRMSGGRRGGRRGGGSVQDQLDYSKRRAQDTAGYVYVGQKVGDMGQRTQETARYWA